MNFSAAMINCASVMSQLYAFQEFHCQALVHRCRGWDAATYAQSWQLAHAVFQHEGCPARYEMTEDNGGEQHFEVRYTW
jgi:hypothetical protein